MEDTNERLNQIEEKLDRIIELLVPVNAHAPFVDDLKNACQSSMILRRFIPVNNNPLLIESN